MSPSQQRGLTALILLLHEPNYMNPDVVDASHGNPTTPTEGAGDGLLGERGS